MLLSSDFIFERGSHHQVCEDYASSGVKNSNSDSISAFAAISDGCSGSPNSDIGSRIVIKCAENKIKHDFPEEELFRKRVFNNMEACCEDLGLNKNALDATLLFLHVNNNGYEIRAYGDGSIIKLKHDGTIEFTLIEYPSNAPLYFNYYGFSNYNRLNQYKSSFGVVRNIYKYIINPDSSDCIISIDEDATPYIERGENEYKVIAVTSDGISSFFKQSVENPYESICEEDIVKLLMDYKTVDREFIQRKMNGFKKHCKMNNWKHSDDFSMAGVSFE